MYRQSDLQAEVNYKNFSRPSRYFKKLLNIRQDAKTVFLNLTQFYNV